MSQGERPARPGGEEEEPPPLLGSWRNLYLAIVAELLLVIAFCAWLTSRNHP